MCVYTTITSAVCKIANQMSVSLSKHTNNKNTPCVHSTCTAVVSHLEVQDGEDVPVRPADNGVEVLKLRGQESSEGSFQAYSSGLLEAQEVRPTDPSHVTGLRSI